MVTIIYFIIYLSNLFCIICINSRNNFFISAILEKILPIEHLNKIKEKYNLNIQVIKGKIITNEFRINTSLNSFDFLYSGKLFNLNETNLDLLSNGNNKHILLINSNKTYEKYINNNNKLIRYLTKAIIIPKNIFNNETKNNAEYCFKELNIYLIDVEKNIFDQLSSQYIDINDTNNYFIRILSKKYDVFPYIGLYIFIATTSIILFIFSMLYRSLIQKYESNYKLKQKIFLLNILFFIEIKLLVLFPFLLELNTFYYRQGFNFDIDSFLKFFVIFLMIYNKSSMVYFILTIYEGAGLTFKKSSKINEAINSYLSSLIAVFYILFHIFVNSLKIPKAFYIISIFIYIPIYSIILYYSLKNIFFFSKIIFKIKKVERYYNRYGPSVKIKLCIAISQFIAYIIYIFLFFVLHKYLLFKQDLMFKIEKDILFQSLDCFLLLLLALIYMPRNWPHSFGLFISLGVDTIKTNKVQIYTSQNYQTTIPKEHLKNKSEIKKFIKNNRQNHLIILNPKKFLRNENENNENINLFENAIKIGILNDF